MIEVSVIIVNYNTKALTKQCIDSIFDNTLFMNIDNSRLDDVKIDSW